MKKILFIFLIFCITIVLNTCDLSEFYYYSVTNKSSRTVSYTFNGAADILEPESVKNYEIKRGESHSAIDKRNIDAGEIHGFEISVILISSGTDYFFIDVEPIPLIVINTLPIPVTLESEYLNNNGETKLVIPERDEDEDEDTQADAEVYTNKPVFKVSPGHYNIILDQKFEDGAVYTVIRSP